MQENHIKKHIKVYKLFFIKIKMPEYQDHRLHRMLKNGLPEEMLVLPRTRPVTIGEILAYDRLAKTSDLTPEVIEPNLDESLIALGYLPSSDKRSCCKNKQR